MAHVAKSDDNVEVDLDTLTSALQSPGRGAGHWAGLVTCPTLCYGMRVIREARAGMTGNWSHSAAEGGHTLTTDTINMIKRIALGELGDVQHIQHKHTSTVFHEAKSTGISREFSEMQCM